MRLRLLPRDGVSWTGYIWLVYLATPMWYAASGKAGGARGMALTGAAIAAFLPLYFWGYWLDRRRALVPIVGIAVIGVLLSPINPAATVFLVYAAAFAGRVGPPAVGVRILLALIGVVGLETWLVGLHADAWGPAVPLIMLVGGLNIVFTEIGRRQVKARRAAENEAQHLAVIAERERIGRDLHDLLGQTLSVITLKAELASKLASRDPDRSVAEIRDVERISREALAEVRRAVQGYGSVSMVDELHHARTALASAGATLECEVAPVTLNVADEQTLALSIREGITNIIRHAHAHRCVIRLEVNETVVQLDIQDDGVGGEAPDGSGLSGMRTRVAKRGGRVERDGQGGTRLTITLPLAVSGSTVGEPT